MRTSLGLRVLGTLLFAVAGVKLLDQAFFELNARKIVLPQFDVRLIPTHDPRVTKRLASVLSYERPPQIIFTGDSRTKCGFDPEVIGRTLGVPPETFFNFGTGSQTVRFTRQVFLIMPVHPSFLRVHEPATSRNQRLLESLAGEKGVDVLYPRRDYSDPRLFTDGHHLSPSGAAWFSADIAHLLRPYLSGR